MLSKKMTFSLMSLITLLAFAFVAPFATAGVLGDKFATTITLNHDAGSTPPLVGDNQVQTGAISIKVVFAKAVGIILGQLWVLMLLLKVVLLYAKSSDFTPS